MDPLSDPATWPPPPPTFPPPPQQPFPFPADNNNHHPQIPPPPYPEMIITAITALKEREGSSRQAIAKYIQSVYLNLPENHATQLTWHLKKMKAEGALAMVKHSYALPGSVPIPVPVSENPSSPTPAGSKRGPGRPPKVKTLSQTGAVAVGPVEAQPNAETMLVSLGLVDGPPGDSPTSVKRGRGRPPRTLSAGPVQPALPAAAKKGRGRPPRAVRAPRAVVPIPVVPAGAGRRGRPPKAGGKQRGRPRKVVVAGAGIGGVGAGVAVKRRGRPPRAGGPVKKPRRLSGKPLGRPKKNALLPANQVAAQHLVAYQDLKNKLEHFQLRVKAAVDLVRPYFTRETAPYAYGALQELEELANTDMTAPPQAPPQAQPQQPLAVTQS